MTERIFIPRTQEYVKDNRKYKKRTMKKRKMKKLTLQERILLCEIDEIDWNYNVKATKTYEIRTAIQREQDKTR